MTMTRICFISNSDRPVLSQHTFYHLSQYCNQHGYDIKLHFKNYDPSRHISWSKIIVMKDVISKYNDFDYYVWIDDDILITNKSIPFEQFLDTFHFSHSNSKDVMISADVQDDTPFNMGILIIKSSAVDVLDLMWDRADVLGNHNKHNWEQDALIDLYEKRNDIAERMLIIPHKNIQSFYRTYLVPDHLHWSPGDFAAHITGMELEKRLEILHTLLNDLRTT